MTQEQPQDNLGLWKEVQATDPAYTKAFTRPSGFAGTAITPTFLVRQATQKFGPMGIGWGVNIVKSEFKRGHVIGQASDGSAIYSEVHLLEAELWYELDGKRGTVYHCGGTPFIWADASGNICTNEDVLKMSLTDATGKALSMLGFSADVYLGLYDDNKYVQDLELFFSQGAQPPVDGTAPGSNAKPPSASLAGTPAEQGRVSARYQQYVREIKAGHGTSEKEVTRTIVSQDTLLTKAERDAILALPELKLDEPAAENRQRQFVNTSNQAGDAPAQPRSRLL